MQHESKRMEQVPSGPETHSVKVAQLLVLPQAHLKSSTLSEPVNKLC